MKRAMRIRIIACLWAVLGLAAGSNGASAGVWACGCQGQLGEQQFIFNREAAFVVEGNQPFGDIKNLYGSKLGTTIKGDKVSYDANNDNGGFQEKTISFWRTDNEKRKITLTEKSSRKISGKHRVICHRDEDVDIYRKVFSFQREDEPARDITMQCIEYQLSTSGGHRGCD